MVASATALGKGRSGHVNWGKRIVCLLLGRQPQTLSGWSCGDLYEVHDGVGSDFLPGARVHAVVRSQPEHTALKIKSSYGFATRNGGSC